MFKCIDCKGTYDKRFLAFYEANAVCQACFFKRKIASKSRNRGKPRGRKKTEMGDIGGLRSL